MKKTVALVSVAIIASVAACILTSAQSSSARRTPILTNEDLSPAAREIPRGSIGGEIQPAESESAGGTIAWRRDLRRALEDARGGGKVVVADVYTDWCGWCKKMDQNIYSDPAVVALSRKHVFVKLNAEDGGQGQSFAAEMGVRGYPTTIILDGEGRVLNVSKGYISSPRAFADLVQRAARP